MKFSNFLNKSIIAGVISTQTELENWMRHQEPRGVSYIGSLILLSIYFEDESNKVGPARMAKHFGCSRGRISQEITKLTKAGLLKRSLSSESARNISLKLTNQGVRITLDLIKKYSRLQNVLDMTIGEKQAENITTKLNELSIKLRSLK